MADVPGGEETKPPTALGSWPDDIFHNNMRRSKKLMKIMKQLNTYASDINYLLKKGIVTLEELNVYFRGEKSRENLEQLLLKLKIYVDIETLIDCPKTDSEYEMEMQKTVKTAFTHLENMCKRSLDSPKKKHFRNLNK